MARQLLSVEGAVAVLAGLAVSIVGGRGTTILMGHPAINLAAVVSFPDARLSEVAVAFLQLEPGQCLGEAEVIEACRGKIASYKIPRHVFFVDGFPMTASGKIQKVKLRDEALRRLSPA